MLFLVEAKRQMKVPQYFSSIGGGKFQSSVTVECKLKDVTLSFKSVQMGLSFQLRI